MTPIYENNYGKKADTISKILSTVISIVKGDLNGEYVYQPGDRITSIMGKVAHAFRDNPTSMTKFYLSKVFPEPGDKVVVLMDTTDDLYSLRVKTFEANVNDIDYVYIITNPHTMTPAGVPTTAEFKYIYQLVNTINKSLGSKYIQLNELERRYLSLFCIVELFTKSMDVKSYDIVSAWEKYTTHSKRNVASVLRTGLVKELSDDIDSIMNRTNVLNQIKAFFCQLDYVQYADLEAL